MSNGVRVWKSKERIAALQEMFSVSSADQQVDEVDSLTEAYHKFKEEYVKHLSFDPDKEKLSKWMFIILWCFLFFCFSYFAEAQASPGSVHLL